MKIDEGQGSPIRLSRSGPDISHLFFVDDLVLFFKVELDQAQLLVDTLKLSVEFLSIRLV